MFCGECGTKNEKDALFCENCGAKLEHEEKKTVKKQTNNKKKKETTKRLSKKQKILIIVGCVVLVLLISIYQLGAYLTNPKQIVKSYIDAINNRDYNELYEAANYSGDKTFISKDLYKKEIKDLLDNDIKINNYNIASTTYEDGGLTAKVDANISATNGSDTSTDEVTFTLTKLKDKKYLIFDNWTLSNQDLINLEVVKNYEINVPKNTEITFNDIKVTDKYLKKSSNKKLDTYSLPQVFAITTKVKFKLASGINLEDELTPSSYNNEYKLNITKSDFSSKEQEEIIKAINDGVTKAMEGLTTNKSFDDVKINFASNYNDDLKEEYEDYLSNLADRNYTISDFKITNTSISYISFDDDYNISVRVKMNYSYTAKSKEDGETDSDKDYNYYEYSLAYDNGYKLADANGFPSIYAYFF